MAALKSLTGLGNGGSRQASGGRARGAWWPRGELLGLDVGSSLIKAVLLSRRHDKVVLKQAVLGPTPAGAATAGEMTDAIGVAKSLRKLCKDYHLGTRQVAVAVSGEKVYTQFEALPSDSEESLDDFIQDAMMKVIPYPFDGAAFDYESVPRQEGMSAGVLWVSSGAEQVEWVREAVTLAGKVPAVVDAQACALANAYAFSYQPKAEEIAVLLHIGPRHMTIALVKGSVLLCSRDATLARDNAAAEKGTLPELVLQELDRRWDLLLQRAAPGKPDRIYVSGGAAPSSELRHALNEQTGLPVEELNPFQTITYTPATEPGRIAGEHGATLAVAVGLALRGLEKI